MAVWYEYIVNDLMILWCNTLLACEETTDRYCLIYERDLINITDLK